MTENERYLFDHFLISIKSGFESLDDIIQNAIDTVEEEGWQREISEEWITETFTREYEKNEKDSLSWTGETDPDKLIKVFDQLCKTQIIALHNIGDTDSEAIYDTRNIWTELEDHGANPIGFCYYSGQDLEHVIKTGELRIGFSGVKENNDKEAILIGNKVASALENAGFTIAWNYSASGKIKIQNFDWKNVFTSYDEIEEKWGYDKVFDLMKD